MQEIQKSIKGTASTLAKTVVGDETEEGPYMYECLTCSLIQVKLCWHSMRNTTGKASTFFNQTFVSDWGKHGLQ